MLQLHAKPPAVLLQVISHGLVPAVMHSSISEMQVEIHAIFHDNFLRSIHNAKLLALSSRMSFAGSKPVFCPCRSSTFTMTS